MRSAILLVIASCLLLLQVGSVVDPPALSAGRAQRRQLQVRLSHCRCVGRGGRRRQVSKRVWFGKWFGTVGCGYGCVSFSCVHLFVVGQVYVFRAFVRVCSAILYVLMCVSASVCVSEGLS